VVVDVSGSNFTGEWSRLNGHWELAVRPWDLARAAITVGRSGRAQRFDPSAGATRWWSGGLGRLYDVVGLVANVMCAIESDGGRLRPRDYYRGLDPAERAPKTGVIGLAMAKRIAEAHLDVPVLHLVDPLIHAGVIVQLSGRTRGDLVGWDTRRRWHVLEAKGRGDEANGRAAVAPAKAQAGNLRLVAAGAPLAAATSSACVTILTDPLHVLLDDPNGDDEEPVVLGFNPDEFTQAYYGSIRALVDADLPLDSVVFAPLGLDTQFRAGRIPTSSLWLGVHEDLYSTVVRDVAAGAYVRARDFARDWRAVWEGAELTPDATEGFAVSIGLDGVILFEADELPRLGRAGIVAR
jgi:hypothetical protein